MGTSLDFEECDLSVGHITHFPFCHSSPFAFSACEKLRLGSLGAGGTDPLPTGGDAQHACQRAEGGEFLGASAHRAGRIRMAWPPPGASTTRRRVAPESAQTGPAGGAVGWSGYVMCCMVR